MGEVFGIVPAAPRSLIFLAAIVLLLLAILTMLGYFAYSSQATRFELREEGLAIRRTLYGRTIAWSSLRLDEATAVNLHDSPELRPTMRTNGIGLPGYGAGWFRLRGGRGLLFVTDRSRIVAIPTTEGYTLMISVADPEHFLARLRSSGRTADRTL